jgi:hypothetical protein
MTSWAPNVHIEYGILRTDKAMPRLARAPVSKKPRGCTGVAHLHQQPSIKAESMYGACLARATILRTPARKGVFGQLSSPLGIHWPCTNNLASWDEYS